MDEQRADLDGVDELSAAEIARIIEALMDAQRQAADPNTVYTPHEDVMKKYREKYGI